MNIKNSESWKANAEVPVREPSEEPNPPREAHPQEEGEGTGRRRDRGNLHVVRHAVLSRRLLQALTRYGENPKALRRMERELRETLKPTGALGRLLFDRFWASILRLIIVARLEEVGLTPKGSASKSSISVPFLREGPTLVFPAEQVDLTRDQDSSEFFDQDVFQRLAHVSRYDRAASREMYRTLGVLLLMRDHGEAGLEKWISATAGIERESPKGSKNG